MVRVVLTECRVMVAYASDNMHNVKLVCILK